MRVKETEREKGGGGGGGSETETESDMCDYKMSKLSLIDNILINTFKLLSDVTRKERQTDRQTDRQTERNPYPTRIKRDLHYYQTL